MISIILLVALLVTALPAAYAAGSAVSLFSTNDGVTLTSPTTIVYASSDGTYQIQVSADKTELGVGDKLTLTFYTLNESPTTGIGLYIGILNGDLGDYFDLSLATLNRESFITPSDTVTKFVEEDGFGLLWFRGSSTKTYTPTLIDGKAKICSLELPVKEISGNKTISLSLFQGTGTTNEGITAYKKLVRNACTTVDGYTNCISLTIKGGGGSGSITSPTEPHYDVTWGYGGKVETTDTNDEYKITSTDGYVIDEIWVDGKLYQDANTAYQKTTDYIYSGEKPGRSLVVFFAYTVKVTP